MEVTATTLIDLKDEIQRSVNLIVASTIKRLMPAKDDLKAKEAFELFGKSWVDYHVKRGNLKVIRRSAGKNSPKFYSRAEMEALRLAEEQINKMI